MANLRALKRSNFLALAASAQRVSNPAFVLQYMPNDLKALRVGLTVTKKHGNAVIRNRIRRRLREAVRLTVAAFPPPAGDYVLIARGEAKTMAFGQLCTLTESAFCRIHKTRQVQ